MGDKLNPYITKKQHFPGSPNNLSTLEPIRDISSKLNPSQLKRFKSSCFGRVFCMSAGFKFSARIIHHLLLRQADHPSDDEMWFVIGGKAARFSRYEFALITGLNCGEYREGATRTTTTSTRLKDKYFDDQRSICMWRLKERFLSCVDEEDTFRLSLVYFLQAVLLSRDSKATIDQQWLSLVDDLESFDNFPWGKWCYELTISYLKRPIKAKIENDLNTMQFEAKRKGYSYYLGGFPYAFQVWAYEAVPILARKYATKKKGNLIPRILCWETPERTGHEERHEAVFSSRNLDVLRTLRATELESQQDYMKGMTKFFNYTRRDRNDEFVGTMPNETENMAANLNHRIALKHFFPTSSAICIGTLNAIQVINGKLNPLQRQRFEASCFGKLLHMPANRQLSRRIIHQLFLSQADHPEVKEIWFVIGSNRARFSQHEFALITGLNCGHYPSCTDLKATTRSTRLKDKYFGGQNIVARNWLTQQFLSCTDEDDTLKLAMIYFLEVVLLGRCSTTSIDQRWLSLVDDLEAFNSFAWGKLCYERTLSSFKNAGKVKLIHGPRKKHRKGYTLSGFPYVFQVWVYEAVPSLASKYAKKKENLIPRVLRWERKESTMYNEIDENVFQAENVEVVKTLEASKFEREQDYMKTIAEFARMSEEKDEDCEEDDAMQLYGIEKSTDSAETVGKKKRKTRSVNDVEKQCEVMAGRKRRETASYIPLPCSKRLVTGETEILDPVRKLGTRDVDDLVQVLKAYRNNIGFLC